MAKLSVFQVSYIADILDCIAVVESVFPIKQIGTIAKSKRDLHIIDPSNPRRTILSGIQYESLPLIVVWRDLELFDPNVGDVILLKKAFVHRYDGRSLNAFDYTEVALNLERDDCIGLKEWWELKELEKHGLLDDFTDDM
jgi:hypothetical protein